MRKLFLYLMAGVVIPIMSIMGFFVFKISQNMSKKVMETVVEETSMPGAGHAHETGRHPRDDGLVTLMPPYPEGKDGNSGRISLELAVRDVCMQARIDYNAEASRMYTDPTYKYSRLSPEELHALSHDERRKVEHLLHSISTYKKYLFPEFENIPWEEAMSRLLSPFNLIYVVENGAVVVKKPESCCKGKETLVSLRPPYTVWKRFKDEPPERTTIRRAVELINEQAGMELDWPKTQCNIGPLAVRYTYPDLEDVTWEDAMWEILSPGDLDYTIEDRMVTLVSTKYGRREPDNIALVTLKAPYAEWARKPDGQRYRLTLKDAVWAVCLQAGMKNIHYESGHNTKSLLNRLVYPDIDRITWEEAMEELLSPRYLTYIIHDDGVLLKRADNKGLGKDSLVTLTPPYTAWRPKSIQDPKKPKISLGGAVTAIGAQAGFRHSWGRSVEGTGGLSKKFIYPDFENVTWEEGMNLLLDPFGLTYITEGNLIVLVMPDGTEPSGVHPPARATRRSMPKPDTNKPVTLKPPYTDRDGPGGKITLQYSVNLICRQAGMEYDWKRSVANTEPLCRQYVDPDFEDVPWSEAMEEILDPLGLGYKVEGGKVVLIRK